jgi:hypothetical protein
MVDIPPPSLITTPSGRLYDPRTRSYFPKKRYSQEGYYKYAISMYAYDMLIRRANRCNYVISPTIPRGLSQFLNDLSRKDFVDSRPLHIMEDHALYIEIKREPRWYYTEIPDDKDLSENEFIKRRLALSQEAINRYSKIATDLMMACVRKSPRTLAAKAIEAIGSGFITPVDWPRIYEHRRYRGKITEIEW